MTTLTFNVFWTAVVALVLEIIFIGRLIYLLSEKR